MRDMVHGSDELWRAGWEVHCRSASQNSLKGVSERTTCRQRCADSKEQPGDVMHPCRRQPEPSCATQHCALIV